MAQLNDLLVMGQSSLLGPVTFHEITKFNNRVILKGNGNNYNECLRLLPATNGWSNIFFSADDTTAGTHAGGWLIGRRGSAGSLQSNVAPSAGDFTIEENSSSGANLTIHKNSGGATLRGRLHIDSEYMTTSANGLRMVYDSYGVILRNDGSNTYFLPTALNDQYGSWTDTIRPFYFNNATGNVTMKHNVGIGGNLSVSGVLTTTDAATFSSTLTTTGAATFNSTLTVGGKLTLQAGQYSDAYDTGALNLQNSNINGVNSIYFADLSDNASEGIHFYRTATTCDSIWVKEGGFYFSPARNINGTAPYQYTVYHTGNISTMTGATASTAGVGGFVPTPAAGKQNSFLRGDGSWATPTSYTLPTASDSTLGGIKVGDGLSINSGVLSVSNSNADGAGKLSGSTELTSTTITSFLEEDYLKWAICDTSAVVSDKEGMVLSMGYSANFGSQLWVGDNHNRMRFRARNASGTGWLSWADVLLSCNDISTTGDLDVAGDAWITGELIVEDTLEVDGTITSYSAITGTSFKATSDRNLKENIKSFKSKASILDLPIYKFDFINGEKNQIGCMAQDLQNICPELVTTNETTGYLNIYESKLIYLLIDEVKQLKQQVITLSSKLKEA